MIVVIQCAASKASYAGHLVTTQGKPVTFVAHPELAPRNDNLYVHPDGNAGGGKSWRDALRAYNREPNSNPLGLLPAYRLYENPVYERLVHKRGVENVYILSAGWGLIRSDFLTPYYDITFSPSARGPDAYKRRRKGDQCDDLCMLPEDSDAELVFFGSKDYVPLFCTLSRRARGTRTVFYRAMEAPDAPGCMLVKFETTTRTNWQYECANAFLQSM